MTTDLSATAVRDTEETRTANVYSAEVSELYDLVYKGRGKNYAHECAVVTELVRARRPGAASLLDVACGTGEHLRTFRFMFDEVEGVELSPTMRAAAAGKVPGVTIHDGDIRRFDTGRTYDAVCSLFGTLGYMTDTAELAAAVSSMAAHLPAGGVLIVEPWYFPARFIDGHIAGDFVRGANRTVARVGRMARTTGSTVRQESHWSVADATGVRHFDQVQIFTLFEPADYTAAFRRAGCDVEYIESGDIGDGRGLFVGVRH
ncbi:class I SAM-dependent methyltransferase [Nonomuraea candida]|uniref:class I SAM-dependent methyltransferase n=1 Tax=Nonomuraea candida TaxID=359159 RepID=UPI000A061C88|nr:class I SAM-dependent methyltransferase [Nonomuraea candida]